MERFLLELLPNRVRRNYRGGAEIDRLQGAANCIDSNRPEEWIASLVGAKNPGLPIVENEGFSFCRVDGAALPLKDIIAAAPEFYLGDERFRKRGTDLGFLLKILDSSMRLHVQVHPTADFAVKHLGSRYGKLETYYILSVRDGANPYIRLGFQHLPSREQWRRIIETQDIAAMDACFEKVPVAPGDVWFIPGGMPHAIGENVLMLEIMEPSDLVVRCEFEREGITVPPDARFMGRDLDFCLDIFHYEQKSVAAVCGNNRVSPVLLEKSAAGSVEELIGNKVTENFRVLRVKLGAENRSSQGVTLKLGAPAAAVVSSGGAWFSCGGERLALRQGRSLFAAAAGGFLTMGNQAPQQTEVCLVVSGVV
ncbi:phosphomannose isomerase [Spirochaetia bacterium]|nr:phosphomannose isomerase [Spirochaetia bacterium]